LDASSVANIPYFMILDKDAEQEAKKYVDKGKLELNKNLFILQKGSIEDYYPSEKLIEAIEYVCGIKLDEEERKKIVEIPRSKNIEEFLKSKGFSKAKKVDIGIKVAESMSVDEIDGEIRGILERIYSSLKIGM
jgi:hypothetical protein